MGFAPGNAEELAALQLMWKSRDAYRSSACSRAVGSSTCIERWSSWPAARRPAFTAAEISAAALRNEAGARAALTMFCSIFGAVAGDFALAHGARGGVYIAGGIAEKIEEFLIRESVSAALRGQGTPDAVCRGNPHLFDRVSGYRTAGRGAVGRTSSRPPRREGASRFDRRLVQRPPDTLKPTMTSLVFRAIPPGWATY